MARVDQNLIPPELRDPKVKKVELSGAVKEKKQPFRDKMLSLIFSPDVGDIKEYLVWDLIMPNILSTITDGLHNTIDMIFGSGRGRYGRDKKRRSNADWSPSSDFVYDDGRSSARRDRERRNERIPSNRLRNFSFRTKADAEIMRENLIDYLERYDQVTVGAYYGMIGISDSSWTNEKYGWRTMADVDIRHDSDGWYLDFPQPEPLD